MSITKPYTTLSLDEAYFIDRLNPIHTGVDAPLWESRLLYLVNHLFKSCARHENSA